MTDGEIVRNYKAASNKKEQIKILADLNLTTVAEIISKLEANGQPIVVSERKIKSQIPVAVYCAVMERVAKLRKLDDGAVDLYGDVVNELAVLNHWLKTVEVKR